jgi:hypothetical protein
MRLLYPATDVIIRDICQGDGRSGSLMPHFKSIAQTTLMGFEVIQLFKKIFF